MMNSPDTDCKDRLGKAVIDNLSDVQSPSLGFFGKDDEASFFAAERPFQQASEAASIANSQAEHHEESSPCTLHESEEGVPKIRSEAAEEMMNTPDADRKDCSGKAVV